MLLVAVIAFAGGRAEAGIASTTGVTVITSSSTPSIPSTLAQGTLESNSTIYAFVEKIDYTSSVSTTLDVMVSGTYNTSSSLSGAGGSYGPGGQVNSYFFHRDPPSLGNPVVTLSGSITFDERIIGVILLSSSLTGSHSEFGLSGTTYTGNSNAALELATSTGGDNVVLSSNLRTLSFGFGAGAYVDQIRILTTPEPGTLALFGAGLLGVGIVARRRRNRTKQDRAKV